MLLRSGDGVEQCGFLLGPEPGLADDFVSVRNRFRHRFRLDRSAWGLVRRVARARGKEIAAFLHTHPSGSPVMSERDLAAQQAFPFVWVIATRRDALSLTAWHAGISIPVYEFPAF